MFETELQMQKEFIKLLSLNKKQNQNILEEFNARFGNVDVVMTDYNNLKITMTKSQADFINSITNMKNNINFYKIYQSKNKATNPVLFLISVHIRWSMSCPCFHKFCLFYFISNNSTKSRVKQFLMQNYFINFLKFSKRKILWHHIKDNIRITNLILKSFNSTPNDKWMVKC